MTRAGDAPPRTPFQWADVMLLRAFAVRELQVSREDLTLARYLDHLGDRIADELERLSVPLPNPAWCTVRRGTVHVLDDVEAPD